MANKNKIQYGNFNLESFVGRFFVRYEIKCSNTKNAIIAIGYFCDIIKGIEFSVKKSKNTYFCILTNIKFVSAIVNGIQAKNIKYCVMKIDVILPVLVLKNFKSFKAGNLLSNILCIAKYKPCKRPHITKFHEAPCQSPPRNITIIKFK